MYTFLIGMVILLVGGTAYGRICERIMNPDDRKPPAITKQDGVEYTPMEYWRNTLLNLINIAGTGPIIGPIQGILFGPIAFILIPIGNIFGGALHDYFSGMMAMRNNGAQMPTMIHKLTNKPFYNFYNVFICFLMLLVGTVFISVPGNLFAAEAVGISFTPDNVPFSIWIIFGVIFAYYLIATVLPLDKFVARIYPFLAIVLLLASIGLGYGLFFEGYITALEELSWDNWRGIHPHGTPLLPIFFVTVACGIVSGFHSTQNVLISRYVSSERQGRMTFYNMMVVEGVIAMFWAAATMALISRGLTTVVAGSAETLANSGLEVIRAVTIAPYTTEVLINSEFVFQRPTPVIGLISRDMLGDVAGMVAIFGVITLAVTTGDTALRSLRLMIGEYFGIDQKPVNTRLAISAVIFAAVAGLLYWSTTNPGGFSILWRYFAWGNQTLAVFAFAIITIYLIARGYTMAPYMALLPGAWYMFITTAFIANAPIGLGLPHFTAIWIGVAAAIIYSVLVMKQGAKVRDSKIEIETPPQY